MSYIDKIVKRKLEGYHILIASLLGALAEGGFLNMGVLNIIVPKVAEKLVSYIEYKYGSIEEKSSDEKDRINFIINVFKDILDPFGKYAVDVRNNNITLIIKSDTCKFCPKGVGEAELPGTLCLFPSLIKELLVRLLGGKFKVKTPVVKKGGYCLFQIGTKEKESIN